MVSERRYGHKIYPNACETLSHLLGLTGPIKILMPVGLGYFILYKTLVYDNAATIVQYYYGYTELHVAFLSIIKITYQSKTVRE